MGRRSLAQALRINDGTARGLLERLAEQQIALVTETGVKLSREGKTRLRGVLRQMSVKKILNLDSSELVPGRVAVGIHLAHSYEEGMTGIPQRDEAVKAGADGSITITVKNGRLVVPPDNRDTADISAREDSRLRSLFKPVDNDLIIIGFSKDQALATAGALAAVLALSPKT